MNEEFSNMDGGKSCRKFGNCIFAHFLDFLQYSNPQISIWGYQIAAFSYQDPPITYCDIYLCEGSAINPHHVISDVPVERFRLDRIFMELDAWT